MQSKPTKTIFEIKSELEKIPVVKEYIKFNNLSPRDQQYIWNQWNQYYEDVKKTPTYALYQAIREAFGAKDMARFRMLQKEMKQMKQDGIIPSLTQPKGLDPMTFYHDQSVLQYKSILSEIVLKKESALEF